MASDWFDICGLDRLSPSSITFMGLFVDDSGSMRVSTVGASLSQFETKLAERQVSIIRVYNGLEEWIDPFLTTLAPREPTDPPTEVPTDTPSRNPTSMPTSTAAPVAPTTKPSEPPTLLPSSHPSAFPVASPSQAPSTSPSVPPSPSPSGVPSQVPTETPLVCDGMFGAIRFAGLTVATSFERGKAALEWGDVEQETFAVANSTNFGCENITYTVLFREIESLENFTADNRTIEERLSDPSITLFETYDKSLAVDLTPGQLYAVLVVASGNGILYSDNREEALLQISTLSPVLNPSVTWIGTMDFDSLNVDFLQVGVTYDPVLTTMSITVADPTVLTSFPFDPNSLSPGDFFAVILNSELQYYQVTGPVSSSALSWSFMAIEQELDDLFEDIDFNTVFEIDLSGDDSGRRLSSGTFSSIFQVPYGVDDAYDEYSTAVILDDSTDRHLEEKFKIKFPAFTFNKKLPIFPPLGSDPDPQGRELSITPSIKITAFCSYRVTGKVHEFTIQNTVKSGAKAEFESSFGTEASDLSEEVKSGQPIRIDLLGPKTLARFTLFIPIPPLFIPFPIWVVLQGLIQFQMNYSFKLKNKFSIDYTFDESTRVTKFTVDKSTSPWDVEFDTDLETKDPKTPTIQFQTEVEASFSAGIGLIFRPIVQSTVGLDLAIFPVNFLAAAVVATAENTDVFTQSSIPFFFNQLDLSYNLYFEVTAWWRDPTDGFGKSDKKTFPVKQYLGLPKFNDAPVPNAAFDICSGDPDYPILVRSQFPSNWGPTFLTGHEDVSGPYQWLQIGDWGIYKFGADSNLEAFEVPKFGLPENEIDAGTKGWLFPTVGTEYEYWLISTYLGLFPFILKFVYKPEDEVDVPPSFAFTCCNAQDCAQKFPDDPLKTTCGTFASFIDPNSGEFGDCVAKCDNCDRSSDCPDGFICMLAKCAQDDGEGVFNPGRICYPEALL